MDFANNLGIIIEKEITLISPDKQWTSILSGKIPRLSRPLTNSSWLLSAAIRNIPSAYMLIFY